MAFLHRLFGRLLPPVSRREALGIACTAGMPTPSDCAIHGSRPSGLALYEASAERCGYVFVPWGNGLDGSMIRRSRVVLISKATGRILCDGSAGDEG